MLVHLTIIYAVPIGHDTGCGGGVVRMHAILALLTALLFRIVTRHVGWPWQPILRSRPRAVGTM
jgi:hypothetical protein